MYTFRGIIISTIICFYGCFSNNSLTYNKSQNILSRDYITFQDFGANGNDNFDDFDAIQKTFDFAIRNNIKIKDFGGKYIIGGRKPIKFNFTKNNQNLFFEGAGKGKTVFIEEAKKTEKVGRYCKMFYHYFEKPLYLNTISLSNFSINKNGKSNNLPKNEKNNFLFEQAHGISCTNKKNIKGHINNLYLKDIEIIDKIGAGIHFTGLTKVDNVVIDNISEKDFSGKFGQRGDVEMSAFSENILIKNSTLNYIQIEPVSSYTSSKKNSRKTKISNCSIKQIEYTDNMKGAKYNFVHITKTTTQKLTLRNLKFLIQDSNVSFEGFFNSPNGIIENTKVHIKTNTRNTLIPVYPTYYKNQKYKTNILFKNSTFLINSDEKNKISGFIIKNNAKVKNINDINVVFDYCTFDNRAEYLGNFYANGNYTIKNSKFNSPLLLGSYKEFYSKVNLINNSSAHLIINNYNNNYNITIEGKLKPKNFSIKHKGGSLKNLNESINNKIQTY